MWGCSRWAPERPPSLTFSRKSDEPQRKLAYPHCGRLAIHSVSRNSIDPISTPPTEKCPCLLKPAAMTNSSRWLTSPPSPAQSHSEQLSLSRASCTRSSWPSSSHPSTTSLVVGSSSESEWGG